MPKNELKLGGDYAPVADRITLFFERYPDGCIHTRLISRTEREITFRAAIFRSAEERRPAAIGWASEEPGDGDVNEVACLENAETSAVGRALANLGFAASRNRPSREEMEKAARARARLEQANAALARHTLSPPPRVRGVQGRPGPLTVRERPPIPRSPIARASVDDDLQSHADRVRDLLVLVAHARRCGVRSARIAKWHDALLSGVINPVHYSRLEARLRDWIRRHRPASG